MWLILLLAAAGVGGYFFARSKYSKPVEDTASKVGSATVDATKEYSGRAADWWQSRFGKSSATAVLRDWANGPGAAYLPEDFRTWLASLSEAEADDFARSVSNYGKSLGYEFAKLVDGSLDAQPDRRQVYVDALVSYSQAYRKARQAQREAATSAQETTNSNSTGDGKMAAEKSASRRKSESETAEPGAIT